MSAQRVAALFLAGEIRGTGFYGISCPIRGSVRLDAGELDHLRPFLSFVGDELAKVGGREREHVATQVGKPRLDFGISKAGVDLLV